MIAQSILVSLLIPFLVTAQQTITPTPVEPTGFSLDPTGLAASLPVYASELPALISEDAGPALTYLASAIQQVAPTARVSDLPAILSSNLPIIEDLAGAYIPPGAIPTQLAAQIPGAVEALVPMLGQELKNLGLPGSLSLAAVPTLVASNLPAVESVVLAEVSSDLPLASSFLMAGGSLLASLQTQTGMVTATGTANNSGTGTGTVTSGATTAGATGTQTTSGIAVVSSGAAAGGRDWVGGVAGAVGMVAAVAML